MGSLEIIMGPMFSGKTELLIEKFNEEWPYQSYVYCASNNYKLADFLIENFFLGF